MSIALKIAVIIQIVGLGISVMFLASLFVTYAPTVDRTQIQNIYIQKGLNFVAVMVAVNLVTIGVIVYAVPKAKGRGPSQRIE